MFYHVLIPVDLALPQQLAPLIETARQLTGDSPHADFNFLYVDDSQVHSAGYPQRDSGQTQSRRRDSKDRLVALVQNLLPEELYRTCTIHSGTVHESILEEAKRFKTDVIVMMAKKPGLSSYFVGSNAERVVRHAKCSVFVLREE